MKKSFFRAILALCLLTVSQFGSAGTCQYNPRTGNWQGPDESCDVFRSSETRFVPIDDRPGHFRTGHNGPVYHCPALARWGGGFLGALGGYVIGKNITSHGHRASGGGAIIGAIAGNQIACELVGPEASYERRGMREEFSNSGRYPGRSGQGTLCTLEAMKDGETVRTKFQTLTPRDCKIAGGFVEEVRTLGDDEVAPRRTSDRRDDGQREPRRPAGGEKLKLEESRIKSSSSANTCRLRVRGNVVDEITVPSDVAEGDETKKFCDSWQRKEAAARGLL